MEELGEEVYEQDEPRGYFGTEEFINMQNCIIHIL